VRMLKFSLLLFPIGLTSCASVATINPQPESSFQANYSEAMSAKWKKEIIDTTSGADYLSESERQVIIEINLVRTDPPEYARRFIMPIRTYYHGNLLQYPGQIAIRTNEGPGAVDECIKQLLIANPQPPLTPKKGLTLAARNQAKDQSTTGATGHAGSNGSTMEQRIDKYGKWHISAGENIDYGNADARKIVASLLIDDGVSSRGHRDNPLDPDYAFIGIGVGPHPVYEYMCVMDFAGDYQ
jgi:uncharacterized protein YkwD